MACQRYEYCAVFSNLLSNVDVSAGSVELPQELHWVQAYQNLVQQEHECFTIFMVCMSFGVSMKLAFCPARSTHVLPHATPKTKAC